MNVSPPPVFKDFLRSHSLVMRIGLLTAGIIILFQTVSFFVIYRYIKIDLYLCLVAIFSLAAGFLLNRRPAKPEPRQPAVQEFPLGAQPGDEPFRSLTQKEMQVLRLLAEGKTNKEIAASHFTALSTVKTHVNNIYGKIAVRNRMEARAKYAELSQKKPFL
jgi:DNA-binding CsgD family transcriptional regulator